jgi:hypothetical protein
MTPNINRFFIQWKRYKTAMVCFLALNVFSVICALVLGINYFHLKKNLGRTVAHHLTQIQIADRTLTELDKVQLHIPSDSHFRIQNTSDEKKILVLLAEWQNLVASVEKILPGTLSDESPLLWMSSENRDKISALKIALRDFKNKELIEAQSQVEAYNDTTRLFIITGSTTLVFGIILPLLVIYLMGRAINVLRLQIQNAAIEFLQSWAQTKASFGDDAFKNVDFWLQMLLLIGQASGSMSRHPAVIIASEMAYLIRIELQKKKAENQSAA